MTKRKRETWTFQPDEDVIELAKALFGEKMSRGDRTRLLNEAVRLKYPQDSLIAARVATAQREVDEANARMERMRLMLSKIKSLNSTDKKALLVAADAKLQREAGQPIASKVQRVPKSPQRKAQ